MRQRLHQLILISPAFLLAMPMFCGSFCLAWQIPRWLIGLLAVCTGGVMALCSWRIGVVAAIMFLAGAARMAIADDPPRHDWRRIGYGRPIHGCFTARVAEAPLRIASLKHIEESDGRIILELSQWRDIETADRTWQPCQGRMLLQPMNENTRLAAAMLETGEYVELTGSLLPLPKSAEPFSGTFTRYLLSLGITGEVNADTLQQLRKAPKRTMDHLRQRLPILLTEGMRDEGAMRSALALGLGLSRYFTRETRRLQSEAGAVHIFAISGMHVGVVMLMAASLLRLAMLPLTLRWLLSGCTVIAYTLLTGASPSSLRAMTMVLLALYAAFRKRLCVWLNSLGVAGFIAILVNPRCVLHTGFQYSYLVVLTMILRSRRVRIITETANEKFYWVPSNRRSSSRKYLCTWIIGAVAVSCDAWLSGCLIGLLSSTHLSLCSPIVNIPLGILSYAALMMCPLKILLSWLWPSFTASFFTPFFEAVFIATDRLSCLGAYSRSCLAIRQLPLSGGLFFAACFIIWIVSTWIENEELDPGGEFSSG